jgi:hypothetical protein
LVAGVAVFLAPVAGSAHHSAANFDLTKEVTIAGTVAELSWGNPHIYLTLEANGADGRPFLQQVEVGPVAAVQTYGVTRDVVAVGSRLTVRAYASRRGAGQIVRGIDFTTTDGSIYPLVAGGRNSRPPAVAVRAENLAGNWVPSPASFTGLRAAVASWPLTDAARAAQTAAQGPVASSVSCEAYPVPYLALAPQLRTIEIGAATVVFRFDADGLAVERTVHLDRRDHPNDLEPSLQGHSIGWWDGPTLVVDTVGFAPHSSGTVLGIPSGPMKHLIERFSLTEERLQIRYEFTLEDPQFVAQPVTYAALWNHRPDLELSNVACDVETARRFLQE